MKEKQNTWAYHFITIGLLIIITIGCKKDEIKQEPALSTFDVSEITKFTAKSGGDITSAGGSSITSKGVCWSLETTPTILDNKTIDGDGNRRFTSNLNGLLAGKTYYIRAYATNSVGTGYGNTISFTTLEPSLPTITTSTVSLIAITTAISGGNIADDGGTAIISRGVCWSTSSNPTIALITKTTDGVGTSTFTSNLNGLASGTLYYVRAYATNSVGTAYGTEEVFTTYEADAIKDIDNNYYNITTIGTQVWMKMNLKSTKYRNGNDIPNIIDNTTWAALTTGAYCDQNNTPSNSITYGKLYNYYTVVDSRNLCPSGWHIPTDTEWSTLITYLGGIPLAGGKLKESGEHHWASPNTGATNESGFTALPGNFRNYNGEYFAIGYYGHWWSNTEDDINNAWSQKLFYNSSYASRIPYSKNNGFSVRCIKD